MTLKERLLFLAEFDPVAGEAVAEIERLTAANAVMREALEALVSILDYGDGYEDRAPQMRAARAALALPDSGWPESVVALVRMFDPQRPSLHDPEHHQHAFDALPAGLREAARHD